MILAMVALASEGKAVKSLKSVAIGSLFLGMIGGAGIASAAPLDTTGDVGAGHTLAQRWCSVCHKVEANATQIPDVPPTFGSIAAMPSTTATSLKVYLQTSHPVMPDLKLSQEEINDAVAYILSLKSKS